MANFPNKRISFTAALEAGETNNDDLNEWVEGWHFPEDLPARLAEYAEDVSLQDFLGMDDDEYQLVIDGETIDEEG